MKKIVLSTVALSMTTLLAFDLGSVAKAAASTMAPTTSTHTTTQKSGDLVSMLTSQLGVTQKQATGGVGSILNYAKNTLPSNKYTTLASAIPNANQYISMAPKVNSASKAMGALSALGGGSSSMASLASSFSSLGLSSDMIGKFVPIITSYLQSSGKTDAMSILAGLF